MQLLEIDVFCLESERMRIHFRDFDSHQRQNLAIAARVKDVGNIGNGDGFVGQQHRGKHLQGFVFRALRGDLSV